MSKTEEIIEIETPSELNQKKSLDYVDGRRGNNNNNSTFFHTKKSVAEGLMDISLLTANANQLKFLLFYNQKSTTFWPAIALIGLSLLLQIIIGLLLIFRRRCKNHGRRHQVSSANDFLILLMFLVTVINILAAALTTTEES